MNTQVIIIDDEKPLTDHYREYLNLIGVSAYTVLNDTRDFMRSLDRFRPKIIMVDTKMPYYSGEDILDVVRQKYPAASVVMLAENTDSDMTVRCIRKGAVSFIMKPVDFTRFKTAYHSALNAYQIQSTDFGLYDGTRNESSAFRSIITRDEKMKNILQYLASVSKSSFPVLITGETGVGKELFAEAVHKASGRSGSYVAVNISGLDDTMFTDTLFGHSKGAFTGADKTRKGLVAEAEKGTLFLDEIGDLNESAQIKLLRLLQEKVYMPLGTDRNVLADVRIIAATSVNLKNKVKAGSFRQDLLYRLSTHCVSIPPLRERRDDIGILALRFYNKALKEAGYPETEQLPEGIEEVLESYSFPGNVRQLQAIINDLAMVTGGEKVNRRELNAFMRRHDINPRTAAREYFNGQFSYAGNFPTLREMEALLISSAIESVKGNISAAAKILGITRQALHKHLKSRLR